ncbi:protein DpdI [Vibrio breoganii]|uniref:protein DpdI n=1 Tax=Vibrio breoganii TaxID=553239 RepID=UPI0021C4B50D|nr:protein DpdI [Vibrio breoganii]MDN3716547.1 protein DpdI [Vibrio breoganii]
MSLKSQIVDLNKQIDYYHNSANMEDQMNALKTISTRIANPIGRIEEEAKKLQCLKLIDTVDLYCEDGDVALEIARERYLAFKNLWETIEDKSLNDEENSLYEMTQAISSTANLFAENHQNIWQEWIDEQNDLANVNDVILDQQKTVHRNIALYDKYVKAKREFDRQLENFNFDQGQLLRIKNFARDCADFKSQMNTEALPESVKRFFDKLNTTGVDAPLSLLTPEVLNWLSENDKLETLVVKQK